MNKYKTKGFTLIELLVVVAIIGVLATVVLSSLNNARTRARDVARLAEVKSLQKALELYYLDNGEYPQIPLASTSLGFRFVATCYPSTSNLSFHQLSDQLVDYGDFSTNEVTDPCIWYIDGAYAPRSSRAKCEKNLDSGYTLLMDSEATPFPQLEIFTETNPYRFRYCIQED